ASDQPGEGGKKVRVQTSFWFIEHHQFRRPGSQERGGPEHVTQSAVRKLRSAERAKQSMLPELHLEAAGLLVNFDTAAGKGIGDCLVKLFAAAEEADGFQSRREIGAIIIQNRC